MFSTCPRLHGAQSAYKDEAALGRGRSAGLVVPNPGCAEPRPPCLAPKHLGPLVPGSRHRWGLATGTDATGPAAPAMAALQPRRGVAGAPSTPARPRGSSSRQESEARGQGEPGSPGEQGAGGRRAVPGVRPPATLSPRGRAGGTAQPRNTGLRSHRGKRPHAGSFLAEVPEPRAGRSLPALAVHRVQRSRCKSPSPAWLQPATATAGAGGRGTPSPCRSVPFGEPRPPAAPGLAVEPAHPAPEEGAASRLAGGRPPDPPSRGQRLRPGVVPPAWRCLCDAEGAGPGEAARGNILPVPVSLPPSAHGS